MAKEKMITIEIPEAQLDFSNDNWKEQVRKDFREIQNSLENNPNPESPAYYTWFWFFMKYGRALCSPEGQAYLKANNLNAFNFVKDVVGLTMSGGGAYTIGYKFFDECLKNNFGVDVSGIKIQTSETLAKKSPPSLPLQQIYYGAPGTGKSHTINEQTESESVIRTTFHPDSDYSTFVGAYKPTMGLLPICDELGQPMKIGSTVLQKEQIIYEFVDQAFLQAYVNAWKYYAENSKTAKKQYLVIEEINRGNCAQIFGDLFQLLDRNDYGFSVYPINADKDMKKQLEKAFKGISIDNADSINQHYKGRNVVKEMLNGEILLLPDNLYIWATMNTSDQSLFPIDSAFKRRWEWQYMPIGKGFDKNGREIKWAIEGATKKYDWWSFLEKINAQVGEATQSEDKKLGFFFCKATNGTISAEKFVGKVIFYLWNDVFKNNGFEGPIFKDVDGTELSFGKFYKSDAKGNAIVQKDKVELFLTNLGVDEITSESKENMDEDNGITKSSNHKYIQDVVFNGKTYDFTQNKKQTYLNLLQDIGLSKIEPIMTRQPLPYNRKGEPIVTKNIPTHVNDYVKVDEYYILADTIDDTKIPILNLLKKELDLDLLVNLKN